MFLKEKLSSLSEKEKIKILASDGMLVKRPILISEKEILIGFGSDKNCSCSRHRYVTIRSSLVDLLHEMHKI